MLGHALTMYIIGLPLRFTTRGWPSCPRNVPLDCDHTICRWATFEVLIELSALCLVRAGSPPGAAHRLGSFERSVTSSAIAAAQDTPSASAAHIARKLLLRSNRIRSFSQDFELYVSVYRWQASRERALVSAPLHDLPHLH